MPTTPSAPKPYGRTAAPDSVVTLLYARSWLRALLEHHDGVVRRHLDDLGEPEPVLFARLFKVGDIAHAPFGIVAAEVGVERFVARRIVNAVATKRAVENESAAWTEVAACACEDALRHVPRRDMDDVGAKDRCERCRQAVCAKVPVR